MSGSIAAFPRYEAYKDSGVAWLDEIPESWNAIRMNFMFKDISQKNRASATLLSVTQDKGVVPRDWVENRMAMPSGNLDSFKHIKKGDFAISLRSFEGGLEYCHHDGIISPAYTVLKATNDNLFSGYYRYLFKSHSFISELQTSVVGIREGKNISYEELRYSLLPIPQLEEQTAIGKFLDKKTAQIDEAIAIKQQQIELLKERKQIIIQQVVTRGLDPDVPMKDSGVEWIGEIPAHWELVKLRSLSNIVRGGSPRPAGHPRFFSDKGVHWVTVGEVTKDASLYLESTSGFLTKVGMEQSRFIEKGTFILTNSGATLGVPKIANINGCINDGILAFLNISTKKINKIFLYYFFSSQTMRLRDEMNQGATQPNLNTDLVKNIKLPLPNIPEQLTIINSIETKLNKVTQAMGIQQEQIERLREYKTTLINSAVTGKIKVPEAA